MQILMTILLRFSVAELSENNIRLEPTIDAPRPLRVAFETLGCRSNYADTVDLQALMLSEGAVPTGFEAGADVYVINTCTVTDNADKEALKLIRRAKLLAPGARIVVTGCMAEVSPEVLAAMNGVDAVVGPGRKSDVVSAIFNLPSPAPQVAAEESTPTELVSLRARQKASQERKSISLAGPMPSEIAGPGALMGEVKTRARYHLRIQEGCENACTYCIIPTSRGSLSSRDWRELVDDVRRLTALGYEEIVLTGTHIGGYGEDTGSTLAELLVILAEQVPGPRLRLSSIDPNDVNHRLIEVLSGGYDFCQHLHICVQAWSDTVLKLMNRRYRLREVAELSQYIRSVLPGICLGSDVIVGFPGERREELAQAEKVFLELPFSYLHVFPYSERAGTAATRLPDSIPIVERKRRSARWRALGERRWSEYLRSLIGKQLDVVVESHRTDPELGSFLSGTSSEFATANIVLAPESRTASAGTVKLVQDFPIGRRVTATAERYDERNGVLVCGF